MKHFFVLLLIVAAYSVSISRAGDISFAEEFALAKDRTEALKKLIPGTEDYYYYHCLHYLNTEQFEKAETLTKPWFDRFKQTARLTEIQTRYALLTYDKNPKKSLDYFRTRLGLNFSHEKLMQGSSPNLPTSLDPKLISRATLTESSLKNYPHTLDNFENSALDWLPVKDFDKERRRNFLARLTSPDLPDLVKLIVDDLNAPNSGGFGSHAIHNRLTLAQLEELGRLKPELVNNSNFVKAVLMRLRPDDDSDWRRNPEQLKVYLDRLLSYVRKLEPVHNPLKAHLLYQKLLLDRSLGVHDKALFIEYLKLPRHQGYMSKIMLESDEARRFPAVLGSNYEPWTLLPNFNADEELVRDYLKHFLADAANAKEFEPFINDVYLKHLFAETKIENGLGEPEQWAALLSPEIFRQLKDRIDIDFAPTNKTNFAADEAVTLELKIKNVPTLMVKVFEINTTNYYRTQGREVDTAINLDGLEPNAGSSHTYTESPFRRVDRKFTFPELTKPGVYVVDFIGAGKSSRALIRKGRLRPIVSTSTVGQKITVLDEAGATVPAATVWLGGQEYKADKNGIVLVPFSTKPGRMPMVISRGDFSCLDYLDHQAEAYELTAGIHVEREALLTQKLANILVRPCLKLNGVLVSPKLLEEVKLRIVAIDQDGIASSTEVPDFKLFEDRESVHEFRVPPRLTELTITLQATVKNLSLGASVAMSASTSFGLNIIAKTEKIEDMFFTQFGKEYVVEVRGRTGEPRPERPVHLQIKHRDFRNTVNEVVKSDAQGRIKLGTLEDISYITATGPEGTVNTWNLNQDRTTYRRVLHAKVGETISLPWLNAGKELQRDEVSLFEMRDATIEADRFAALSLAEGALEIKGLLAGDFELTLKKTGGQIRIRVVDGILRAGYVVGSARSLQVSPLKPLRVSTISTEAETVSIKFADVSPTARVHVFATRYQPFYSAFNDLGRVRAAELSGSFPTSAESLYLSGRNIGDEYRYVLDRRNHKIFPGNMLDRPALLLNPWVLRSTETGEQLAQAGEDYKKRLQESQARNVEAPMPSNMPADAPHGGDAGLSDFANLDFLGEQGVSLLNLVPNKEGIVKINRKDLGDHSMITIVAVDPLSTTVQTFTLPETPMKIVDLRLRNGLDPQGHFGQRRQVNIVPAHQPFTLADAAGSRFEAYDTLPKVFGLYSTLTHDPKLAEFSFILTWPTLKKEEKQTLYSKFACHELNFFLSKKDPEFFKEFVKPYLTNKRDKTFLDHWLLENDLQDYLRPWAYDRLNSMERILLAQRIAGEPVKTSRHLGDLVRLLPPQGDQERFLFDSALQADGLKSDSTTEIARLRERVLLDANKADSIPPSRISPVPSGGGLGGGFPGAAGKPGAGAPERMESQKGEKQAARDGKSKDLAKEMDKEKEAFNLQAMNDTDREGPYVGGNRKMALELPGRLYRKVDITKELAENNYYKLPINEHLYGHIPVNNFWVDYSKHEGKAPFLSPHLAEASRNFAEMLFALSVLDLPFAPGKHDVKFDNGKMTYTPGNTVLVFHEEVMPTAPAANKIQILVSQNFYRVGDRYRDENGERFDKFVTQEFVIQTVYGCQVVVTNPTPSKQRLSVLIQVPVGALPVANGQPTKSVQLDLDPYRTQIVDYQFYFPLPGQFAHFPVHVSRGESLVAFAAPFSFNVVEKPTKLDKDSWDYVSQNGSSEEVIAMMNRENLNALDLSKIAFRMKDKDFFESVIALLQSRHVYDTTLWSYSVYHSQTATVREFLSHSNQTVNECGGPIQSPLLIVDPIARHQYQFLEYKPLVNARAHSLGQQRQIVNGAFLQQYEETMRLLGYRAKLTDEDELAVTYYLLLQDRVDEALETFAKVDSRRIAEQMQYDYCAAYLDMFGDDWKKARATTLKYANHPVDRWKNAFASIANTLDEIEGKAVKVADKENRDQQQAELAAKEPSFEFTLDSKGINLTWKNIETAKVNYYLMDVELLFSRNPFVQQSGSQFAMIKPNSSAEVKLPADKSKVIIALPKELANKNVLVEITANGKTQSLPYYANAMTVTMKENYGQLQVTDEAGKSLSKVYVKTYVRLADGSVKFHKDGYTDQRGKFDYASVSTPERTGITRFGILILSEGKGAMIKEAAPPQQ